MTDDKKNEDYLGRKLREFYEEKGYIPEYFVPYNKKSLDDGIAPTLGTSCGTFTGIGSIVIIEKTEKEDNE